MLVQALKKVATELEFLTQYSITLERALDLLETTTQDLEEIVAINTMRESMLEIGDVLDIGKQINPEAFFSSDLIQNQISKVLYHA